MVIDRSYWYFIGVNSGVADMWGRQWSQFDFFIVYMSTSD